MALGSFELDISRFVAKARGNIDLVIRRVALDIFKRVIWKSPVKSGRFKGNWQVAIGAIPSGTIELKDTTGKGTMSVATLSRVQADMLGLKAGDIIYLVNNLAYSRRLEYGYSKQASAGMVRTTLSEFPQVVRTAATGLGT